LGYGAGDSRRGGTFPSNHFGVILHTLGKVGLFDGENWTEATSGDFLYVPEGGLHGFRNASDQPASMLILFAPGAPREAYFEGLAEIALGRRQFTPEEFKEFCERHDNIVV
jgi:hypothetical protein